MYVCNIIVHILIQNACQGTMDRFATFHAHFQLSEKGVKDFVIAAGINVMCLQVVKLKELVRRSSTNNLISFIFFFIFCKAIIQNLCGQKYDLLIVLQALPMDR